jgi:hypothetical protein
MPLALSCSNEEKITVNARPQSSSGKPATIDGALTVTVVSGDGTVEQDPATPLSFKAVSGDALADTVYDVAGDADMGAGVVTIHDTVTLSVTSAVAANFGLTAGAAELK